MNQKVLHTLEFDKILNMLSVYAQSARGKQMCLELTPESDFEHVSRLQAETEEAVILLTYSGSNPVSPFEDVREYAQHAQKGSVLSPKMLMQIASCLRSAKTLRKALVTDRENTPLLRQMGSSLDPLSELENEISTCIIGEEEIADQASPELANIRRHIRIAGEKIREKLNTMAHGSGYAKYLMEPIVTVRNGRYVLPVRQECRQNVPGLIHDQSSTGSTLFIEPMAVVELGNDLKEWRGKEDAEIEKILRELSYHTGRYAYEIENDTELMAKLDVIFAKGAFARAFSCCAPKINHEGRIRLLRARHPLISPDRVVPSTLWLGEEFTTLVITGPNTGGKTVTLKTMGLFTLMMQSGMQIPADFGSELAVFDDVFADIGDEQSIEQSLSTFSAHMTNIVSIMDNVQSNDLVLLDELGAGTDPTEGAALAQTILARLTQSRIRTAATTHYSELKAYALSTVGVENASVEFDIVSLSPTYRISIGVPGKSNAFEIAKRLGLDEGIIRDARELLSYNDIKFEDVLTNAEYHLQVAERERKIAEEARQETVRLRNEAERLYKETEEKRQNATQKAKEEARRIIERARRESDVILSEMKKIKKNGTDVNTLHALQRRLDGEQDMLRDDLLPDADPGKAPDHLDIGDKVEIAAMHIEATVLSLPDEKGEVALQAGSAKMKLPLAQLRFISHAEKKQKKPNVASKIDTAAMNVKLSCDVRGCNLEEALTEVNRYLSEAMLAGLHEVTIVHGKGSGILRAGIQQDLKMNPRVKQYRNGRYGEGEEGVTVVTLK